MATTPPGGDEERGDVLNLLTPDLELAPVSENHLVCLLKRQGPKPLQTHWIRISSRGPGNGYSSKPVPWVLSDVLEMSDLKH